jgi:5-methylcytosine-specific restriction endonuclease McrA
MPAKRRRQPRKFVGAEEHARNRAYGRRYRQNRSKVLGRSRACALRLPGCTQWATETDHVVEAGRGGPSTVDNLVPCCRSCNQKKRAARARKRGEQPPRPSRDW